MRTVTVDADALCEAIADALQDRDWTLGRYDAEVEAIDVIQHARVADVVELRRHA